MARRRRTRSLLRLLMFALALPGASGCSSLGTLAGAANQAEAFSYKFLRLVPDANQNYVLRLDRGTGCQNFHFDKFALAQAVTTKQLTIARTTVPFSFDLLERCVTAGERRFETGDLAEPVNDSMGNPTGEKARPRNGVSKLVDAGISQGGVISVLVFGFQFSATTTSRTAAPGPLQITEIDVPKDQISGATDSYTTANANAIYVDGRLVDVPNNPPRINATFSFLAKTVMDSPELLLVWDGEMVLRTDL